MLARMTMEDDLRLEAIRDGDADELARLLQDYRPLAHAVLFARTGDLPGSGRRVPEVCTRLQERLAADPAPTDLPAEVRILAGETVSEVASASAAVGTKDARAAAPGDSAANARDPSAPSARSGEKTDAAGGPPLAPVAPNALPPEDSGSFAGTGKLRLHRALLARAADLDGNGRAVFVLRYLYRVPYADIARLLGLSGTDARLRVQAIHAALADEIARHESAGEGISTAGGTTDVSNAPGEPNKGTAHGV